MASVTYNVAKTAIGNGSIDLDTDDLRIALVMTNTTVDTENATIDNVSDFTTLDECNATGYARAALANETITRDNDNNRAILSADNVTFSGLSGDATRNIQGALIFKHVTNDAASIPVAFLEFTAAIAKESTSIVVPLSTSKILFLT
jgi:hypothetical protein